MQPNVLRPSAAKAEGLLVEAQDGDADIPLALHLHIHISEASAPNRYALLCRWQMLAILLPQIMPQNTVLSVEMLRHQRCCDLRKTAQELNPAEITFASSLHLRPDMLQYLRVHTALVTNRQAAACRSASTAGRGEPAADRLTGQGPWQHSQGHLLHMASHTFVRIGRYHDGVLSNVRAFEADMDDSEHCRVPYLPEHNLEMLIYAATTGGEVRLLT